MYTYFMDNLNNVTKTINSYLGLVFKIGIVLVILTSFFLFANTFTELYDTPKFLVLFGFTAILLLLLTLRFTVTGKVVFVRTPLDIPLILLLTVAVVSTFVSPAPYVSLLGNQMRIHGSLISVITYVLFYFILVNNLRNTKEIKWVFNIAVIASQILAVISLITFAGIKILPAPWNHGINFTTTGSAFSTTGILAMLIPFIIMSLLSSSKPLFTILNSLFLLITGLTIALTGSWATWIGALVSLALTLFVTNIFRDIKQFSPVKLISLIVPLTLVALVTVLSFVPPMGGTKNPIYTQAQNFPKEIQLGFINSWKISVSSFRDAPFWGSGPSTYMFDFTNYKPIEFNSSKFWNLRFDSPFNEYLQVLATLGGIGILALLSLTALFISAAYKILQTTDNNHKTLAIAGIVFFILLALHTSTLPLWIVGIIILASFMKINLPENISKSISSATDLKDMLFRIATNVASQKSGEETIKVDALPGILLIITASIVIFGGFFGGKILLADYHHRLALNAVTQNNGIVTYNELVIAEKLNPKNDLYRTDLAQTNFALANAIASAKGPTEASPTGSLTDQDKQNIQVLLQQSINEGRIAVTLSPKSAANWEILAQLYRQIAGVAQNALVFSLDAYGQAIFQDPLNPNLRLSVGGVYYAVKSYDMAVRFFSDSINLKPDFANGYFNLSVALRDKGDLTNAQAMAEKTLTLIEKGSPDYQPLTDYIADLKKRIEEGTTKQSEIQPPASQTTGALQQKELPKVINLPQPEKIATPEAIKKPEASPSTSPGASATPTPTP